MASPLATLTTPSEETPRFYHFLTPDRIQLALDALSQGYSLTGAARQAGVDRSTLYRHLESVPELRQAVADMREQGIDSIEDVALQSARVPDPRHFLDRIAWLKAHRREKWGDKVETTARISVQIIMSPPPTPEELRATDDRMLDATYKVLPSPATEAHDADST